jgi:hypothetical protein
LSKKKIKRDKARSARRSELIPRFTSLGGIVQVWMQSTSVCPRQGKYSLSKLKRKSEDETLSTSFGGKGSKTKTFEHLEIFPSPGEQRCSRGGAKKTIRSVAGIDRDRHIRVHNEG